MQSAPPVGGCWHVEGLLTPALVTLYLSLVIVFVVYPRSRNREGKLGVADLFVAVAASELMPYGLYSVLS